jgi:hypothetical protein
MNALDTLILQAVAARDAMSKCLYGALFDWIVLHINTTTLSKNTTRQHQVTYLLMSRLNLLTVHKQAKFV